MIDVNLKQHVLSDIDRAEPDIIATLQRLIRFQTVNPPGNEGEHQAFIGDQLEELGLIVHRIEAVSGRTNIVGILKGTGGGKNLLHYAGHADVVDAGDESKWHYPPFGGDVHDGWIYGRGSVDHKAPIAASLEALRVLITNGIRLRGDLVFFVPVDEELGSFAGTKHVLTKDILYGDMGIYASAGFLEQVLISCSGSVSFEVTVRGKTAHGGWSHKGINAIALASKLVLKLQSMTFSATDPLWSAEKSEHDRLSPAQNGTLTVTSIEGSSPAGSVPDTCVIRANRRLVPSETVAEAKAQIEAVLADLRREDPNFVAELSYISAVNGMNTAPDDPLVSHVSEAVRDIGHEPEIGGSSGGFDARWIIQKLGIPFVSYGAGWNGPDGKLCLHVENEAITVKDLIGMARAYAMIMIRVCGVSDEVRSKT